MQLEKMIGVMLAILLVLGFLSPLFCPEKPRPVPQYSEGMIVQTRLDNTKAVIIDSSCVPGYKECDYSVRLGAPSHSRMRFSESELMR